MYCTESVVYFVCDDHVYHLATDWLFCGLIAPQGSTIVTEVIRQMSCVSSHLTGLLSRD